MKSLTSLRLFLKRRRRNHKGVVRAHGYERDTCMTSEKVTLREGGLELTPSFRQSRCGVPNAKKLCGRHNCPIPNAKATKDTKDTVICHAAERAGEWMLERRKKRAKERRVGKSKEEASSLEFGERILDLQFKNTTEPWPKHQEKLKGRPRVIQVSIA